MNHTPGPWVKSGHFIYGPIHAESRHTNGRVLIAEVVRGSHRADPQLDGGADRFEFDSEADARLIAAAPELVEACLVAVVYLDELMQDLSGDVWWENHLRTQLRAALAKAGAE